MRKIVALLIALFSFPMVSLAVNYDIKNYYIDATILENGDMEVTELIVMKGTFNGYEVGILYNTGDIYSASGMENVAIYGKTDISEDISFDAMNWDFSEFSLVNYASEGDILKYTLYEGYGENTYRMYYRTNNSTTAFLFKYTLKDVAIYHNDCVELYWNFFGDSFNDDITDLNIRVNFRKKLELEDFNWWFHGDLTGTSNIDNSKDTTSVVAHVDKIDAYSPVDFRVLLPTDMFDKSLVSKQINDDVRNLIIDDEDEIVRQDLAYLKNAKTLYYITVAGTSLYYLLLIGLWVYAYFKYDKERKPEFQNEYNRDFIDDYNVEVVDYLMNKNITSNAMSASIMNMIYKKNIVAEAIEGEKDGYKFTLNNTDGLNDTENMLADFLFKKVGSDNTFTTSELKKYASGTKTCETYINTYTRWNEKVRKDAEKQAFFENGTGKAVLGLIAFLGCASVFMFAVLNNVVFFPTYLMFLALFIFIVYLAGSSKKTEKGIEHYAKWKAFKKFLQDFGAFDIKELPEIALWERYLVYATVFGLAKQVEKAMNVKIKELVATPGYEYVNDIFVHNHIHIANVIDTSFRAAHSGAQSRITQNIANSSGGSFGGHGGGFSSGGGFGGGGRSGGGF